MKDLSASFGVRLFCFSAFAAAVTIFLTTAGVSMAAETKTVTNSLGMKFVYIKPGTFMMGSPASEVGRYDDETQHQVTLTRGFYMQTTEVTQGQWRAVMGNNPSYFKNCGANCPVERVSWNDAKKFIRKLNQMEGTQKYRLPTEAEWEYAARAGTQTPFSFGRCLSTDQANYHGKNPMTGCAKGEYRNQTIRVSSLSPNAWGLYDIYGNVWEWCEDWYGKYPTSSATDPTGPSRGGGRVIRSGCWASTASGCRSASRSSLPPIGEFLYLGFRLARTP
jgi:formylglycine-generating enzyme required for sulfatase activity